MECVPHWGALFLMWSNYHISGLSENSEYKGEKIMEIELEKLLNDYLRDFSRKSQSDVAVKDSIPIVWFGDMEAYKESRLKIVTVGLNPSLREFEEPRFNVAANSAESLYETLNDYFNFNPYKWFRDFEKCLNLIDASFGGKMSDRRYANTAISLDAYSAIATNPTWRYLSLRERNAVEQSGLFDRLLEYLQPDVILMSAQHDYFMDVLHISRPQKLFYNHRKVEVYKEHNCIMVYGFNFKGVPFGVKKEIKEEAFAVVRNAITELLR